MPSVKSGVTPLTSCLIWSALTSIPPHICRRSTLPVLNLVTPQHRGQTRAEKFPGWWLLVYCRCGRDGSAAAAAATTTTAQTTYADTAIIYALYSLIILLLDQIRLEYKNKLDAFAYIKTSLIQVSSHIPLKDVPTTQQPAQDKRAHFTIETLRRLGISLTMMMSQSSY